MRAALLSLLLVLPTLSALAEPPAGSLPDREALVDMVRRGDHAALEPALTGLQQAYRAYRVKEEAVHAAFAIFVNSDPAMAGFLDEWVRISPDSYAAHLARAYHYRSAAWNARGRGFVSRTPVGRLRRMEMFLERAEISARRAVELNPRLSVGHAMLLKIVRLNGDREAARQVLDQGLRAAPESLEIRRAHAWMLHPNWGGTPEQRDAFVAEIEADAETYPALRPLLGYSGYFASLSLPDEQRVDHLTAAIERGGQWYYFLYQRGRVLYRLGRHEEAIADFDRALAQRPHAAEILEDRADAYKRLGNGDAALADLDEALGIDPLHPILLTDRAKQYRRLDRHDDARADLDRALVYGEQDHYVRAERGRLYLYDDADYAAAVSEWRLVTELKPDRAQYWYDYSVALYHRHDCRIIPALERYRAICEADSDQRCADDKMTWAEEAPDALIVSGDCPRQCSPLARLLSLCG